MEYRNAIKTIIRDIEKHMEVCQDTHKAYKHRRDNSTNPMEQLDLGIHMAELMARYEAYQTAAIEAQTTLTQTDNNLRDKLAGIE